MKGEIEGHKKGITYFPRDKTQNTVRVGKKVLCVGISDIIIGFSRVVKVFLSAIIYTEEGVEENIIEGHIRDKKPTF